MTLSLLDSAFPRIIIPRESTAQSSFTFFPPVLFFFSLAVPPHQVTLLISFFVVSTSASLELGGPLTAPAAVSPAICPTTGPINNLVNCHPNTLSRSPPRHPDRLALRPSSIRCRLFSSLSSLPAESCAGAFSTYQSICRRGILFRKDFIGHSRDFSSGPREKCRYSYAPGCSKPRMDAWMRLIVQGRLVLAINSILKLVVEPTVRRWPSRLSITASCSRSPYKWSPDSVLIPKWLTA